jgi:hypothetical protein
MVAYRISTGLAAAAGTSMRARRQRSGTAPGIRSNLKVVMVGMLALSATFV